MMRKIKLLSLIFFLTCTIIVRSQTIQPDWKFYIAFEDATGAKDTVFFVLDSSATFGLDSTLGEVPIVLMPDTFQVYWGNMTKIRAYQIVNGNAEGSISAVNYTYPIVISWDTNLYHSPALSHRMTCAEMDNDYFFFTPETPCHTFNMLNTDHVIAPPFSWFSHEHFPLAIYLNNFNSCCYSGINENDLCRHFLIFPNPVLSTLTIGNLKAQIDKICIYNLLGELMFNYMPSDNIRNSEIYLDVGFLKNGVYIIKIKDSHKILYYEKFIKN